MDEMKAVSFSSVGRGLVGLGVVAMVGLGAWACSGGSSTEEPTYIPSQETPAGEVTEVEGSVTYTFTDTDFDSLIYVQVLAVPGTAGHDHVMRAGSYSGTITWDSSNVEACAVDISLDVESILVDEDAMRDLVGYDTMLSDNEKKSVRNNMLSDGQLDSASFPTMRYSATSCATVGSDVRMTGDLTVHGVTKSLNMEFTPTLTTEGLFASGTMTFKHSDFGITPYKLFNYENADEITMTLTIHGVPPQ